MNGEPEAHERLAGGVARLAERSHRLPAAKGLRSGRSARNILDLRGLADGIR